MLVIEPLIEECLKKFRSLLNSATLFHMLDAGHRDDFIEACRIIYENNLESYMRDVHYYAQDNMKYLVTKKDGLHSPWAVFLTEDHSACVHAWSTLHEKMHHSQMWPTISKKTDVGAYVAGQKVSSRNKKRKLKA